MKRLKIRLNFESYLYPISILAIVWDENRETLYIWCRKIRKFPFGSIHNWVHIRLHKIQAYT